MRPSRRSPPTETHQALRDERGSLRDRRGALDDERGSASLEFLAAGVLLLVPLVYLVVTLGQVERAAFATEGAARHAARILADRGVEAGRNLAKATVAQTAADFGIDMADTATRITCSPNPADCSIPGTVISVEVATDVALPLVPAALELAVPLSVPVDAAATARLSDFASSRR